MNKIKTPGAAEAKRFEEVLAKMPEVKAYQRQEQRVERATQAVEDAEADLSESDPDAAQDEAKKASDQPRHLVLHSLTQDPIRTVNETLAEITVQPHRDKTSIGRTQRGFAFLRCQVYAARLTGAAPRAAWCLPLLRSLHSLHSLRYGKHQAITF